MKTVSIVVPVYYNAQSLPALFDRLCAVESTLREKSVEMELVFVDDGSGDDSLAQLLRLKSRLPRTKIVKLTRNFGAIRAIKCGFSYVTGDAVVVLVADLQDPPELIPALVDRWLAGSRFVVCERIGRSDPVTSRVFSWLYYKLLRVLVMADYPAGGYDLALMDARFLPHLRAASKSASVLLLAYWLGYKADVIAYRREARAHGRSRWTLRKKIHAFVDVMLGFSNRPLRLMSLLGMGVAGLSFLYGGFAVIVALAGFRPVPGFASLAALISFLLGVVIVMLGTIGEYLARILEELNGRPEVVVDEIF